MAKNQSSKPFQISETLTPNPVGQPLWAEGDLARYLNISVKTLQANRLKGVGVPWIKVGRLVRYRPPDVLAYEEANLCQSTSSDTAQRRASREK